MTSAFAFSGFPVALVTGSWVKPLKRNGLRAPRCEGCSVSPMTPQLAGLPTAAGCSISSL